LGGLSVNILEINGKLKMTACILIYTNFFLTSGATLAIKTIHGSETERREFTYSSVVKGITENPRFLIDQKQVGSVKPQTASSWEGHAVPGEFSGKRSREMGRGKYLALFPWTHPKALSDPEWEYHQKGGV
jgi:hypothetical protein